MVGTRRARPRPGCAPNGAAVPVGHNGPSSDLVTGADGQAAAVAAARTVTCGDQTSGPREPES